MILGHVGARFPLWLASVLFFAASAGAEERIKQDLDRRIEAAATAPKVGTQASRSLVAKARLEAMRTFYEQQQFRPIWLEGARPSVKANQLLAVLAKADDEGLRPDLYGVKGLAERVRKADPDDSIVLEIDLTIAYIDYAGDVSSGVVENPRQVAASFRDAKRPAPATLLEQLAAAGDTQKFLAGLAPDTRRYQPLKAALARYRDIEKKGGWPVVSKGPTLKPSMSHARVVEVRRRLATTGDLPEAETSSQQFDVQLVAAVKKFQQRHGLVDDGNVGADTVAEMNVAVQDRIEQLVINLERRRWLAGHLGDRYIYVNIADNDIKVVEKDRTIHVARAVVGKPFHETPVFSGSMTYIELSPYWNVPHSIATRDLLPKIKQSPGFIESNNYLLLTRMGDNSSAVASSAVDWNSITAGNFRYHLRQKPGPGNALGGMAFMFPNAHNVFLHDTSTRTLFSVEDRYFSSGCVRVQFPMKLALLLLSGQDGGVWTERRIQEIIEKRDPVRVNLKNPIPVHITYLTAWADTDGTVHFRKDAYKRDGALKATMRNVGLVR